MIALIAALIAAYQIRKNRFESDVGDKLALHFIDIGQGDCALIVSPGGETLLIDAGPDASSERVISYIKGLGINGIDHMMLSHLHEDHCGAADDIAKELTVKRVYTCTDGSDAGLLFPLFSRLSESGCEHIPVSVGFTLDLGKGVRAEVLCPSEISDRSDNDESMIVRISYGETSFLFAGDAEEDEERELLKLCPDKLSCDLLKVAHHGSSSSSCAEFISAVSPSVAVISCEKNNSYGHPHKSVLDRLEDIGAKIYRTDISGDVLILSDKERLLEYNGRTLGAAYALGALDGGSLFLKNMKNPLAIFDCLDYNIFKLGENGFPPGFAALAA